MKLIFTIAAFIVFSIAVIFGGEYLYDSKIAGDVSSSNSKNESLPQANQSAGKVIKPVTKQASNRKIISNTPPHFSAGFDWSLAKNTKVSKNSGFIAEDSNPSAHVNNRFIILRWKDANPQRGHYDFSRMERVLKRIAPQQALVRLEVNSSCEAPDWALKQLWQTKLKSLIYWDKSYIDLTKPFIENFAKRYASHPQILGVQLGLADGEFGEAADSCDDYNNKNGWGEFWMSPSERAEAESQYGFNPEVFTQATKANIDIYANAFGTDKNKLAFTNIGTLFTYGEGADPYNKNLKTIAKYALDLGIGNRDGAVERWMSYTDKIYGSVFTTMPDGSCRLDVNEHYMRKLEGRYWGTENEFYGNKDYVTAVMGPVKNHPYIYMISSLRALQMRRNAITISNMEKVFHKDYKTQDFMKYLSLTMGKTIEDTPDAFVLMGERYIVPYRLADQMDVACVSNNKEAVPVRSFGRWLTESPHNTQVENKAAIKVTMPASENKWYQGYYLPENIDYEYFAREAKQFSFDLNEELSQQRCKNGCEVEIKATFKDTRRTKLQVEVAEGISMPIQTLGDNAIKTATFKIKSQFKNQLTIDKDNVKDKANTDLRLFSDNHAIPLILLRINFLN